ncbi:MAG TPA: S41 family peptidase [Usitatibacter sp.]
MTTASSRRAFLHAGVALALQSAATLVRGSDAGKRAAIVHRLAKALRENYHDEAAAGRLADAVLHNLDARAYDDASMPDQAFADRLTVDLRAIVDDKHMAVMSGMSGKEPDINIDPVFALRQNYGVQEVRRLSGNVGLIELNYSPSLKLGDPLLQRYAAAMALVADTRALILDLRRHFGGDPPTIAYFLSYFFDRPAFVVNRIRYRPARLAEFSTTAHPRGKRYGEQRPLFVLTAPETFSGGEEIAYDLQATQRARVVGEVTGGGANPNEAFELGDGFVAYVPNGAARNPITGTNWERTGLQPDVKVAAAKALDVALRLALEAVLEQATDEAERQSIRDALKAP